MRGARGKSRGENHYYGCESSISFIPDASLYNTQPDRNARRGNSQVALSVLSFVVLPSSLQTSRSLNYHQHFCACHMEIYNVGQHCDFSGCKQLGTRLIVPNGEVTTHFYLESKPLGCVFFSRFFVCACFSFRLSSFQLRAM
jgi:hypothetical protein